MSSLVQIFVKGFDGKTFTVNFTKTLEKIFCSELFTEVSQKTGFSADSLRLLFGTRQLENDGSHNLPHYGLQNLSTIFLVFRLPGGINPFVRLTQRKATLKPLEGFVGVVTNQQCMITLDDDENVRKAKMPCGHIISPIGMTQFCWSVLDNKKYTFSCPSCKSLWDFSWVKHVACLSPEEISLVETELAKNYALNAMGVQNCPGCNNFCCRADASVVVKCIVCTQRSGNPFEFCWFCLHQSQGSDICKNASCTKRDKRLDILARSSKKTITDVQNCPSLRACPWCGILIEHTRGCKQMNCSQCKKDFCFICLKKCGQDGWRCGTWNSRCIPAPIQTSIVGC